jgi:hypothetical protein
MTWQLRKPSPSGMPYFITPAFRAARSSSLGIGGP